MARKSPWSDQFNRPETLFSASRTFILAPGWEEAWTFRQLGPLERYRMEDLRQRYLRDYGPGGSPLLTPDGTMLQDLPESFLRHAALLETMDQSEGDARWGLAEWAGLGLREQFQDAWDAILTFALEVAAGVETDEGNAAGEGSTTSSSGSPSSG